MRSSCNTFRGRGKEWEREVHLDFFDEDDQSLVFSQEAGIRLHGNQSRVAEPQKSFNLYARSSYDGNNTYLDLGNEIYKGSTVREDMEKFARMYKEAGILQSLRYPPVQEMHRYKNDPSYISEINKLCDDIAAYFEARMDYAPSHLADYFSLSGKPALVTVENTSPKGGKVSINTVTPALDEDGKWTGTYFTDYPVTLTAEPEEGWVFAGWKSKKGDLKPVDDYSSQLQFIGDVNVKAVFRKDSGKEELTGSEKEE